MLDKRRVEWIDVAKAIGIIVIVWGHTMNSKGAVRQFLYSFNVPLFFFMSGITYRYEKRTVNFVRKKITRLYFPYLVWSVISVLVLMLAEYTLQTSLLDASHNFVDYISQILYASTCNGSMKWNTPLWCLPCLLVAYLMMDMFERLLLKTQVIREAGEFSIWRVVFICASILCAKLLAQTSYRLPFQADSAVILSAFMQIGYMIKIQLNAWKVNKNTAWIVLVSLLTGFFLSYLNGRANVSSMDFGKSIILYIITASINIYACCSLAKILESKKALGYIGRHTLAILVMHKFPIVFFQLVVPFTKIYLAASYAPGFEKLAVGMLITPVVIVLCLMVERLIDRVAPWMFGL